MCVNVSTEWHSSATNIASSQKSPLFGKYFWSIVVAYDQRERFVEEPIYSSLLEEEPDLEDLVRRYLISLPDFVDELLAAYDARDWDKLRASAHNLKATAGNYGYMPLSEMASEIMHFKEDDADIDQLGKQVQDVLSISKRAALIKDS